MQTKSVCQKNPLPDSLYEIHDELAQNRSFRDDVSSLEGKNNPNNQYPEK